MTTYNGASLLPATVDAILAQTYEDFEFLIVDDGSADDTAEVIRSYQDPRIRFLPSDVNTGISSSRNRAMSLARGEFLAATDQDDISRPERLARQIEYLDANPDLVMVSSAVVLAHGPKHWPDPSPTFTDPHIVHLGLFFGRHNITYSTICARLEHLRLRGLAFRQEYHYAEDFEFYHRLAKIGDIATLPERLVVSRIHANNTSTLHSDEMHANGMRFMSHAYAELLDRSIERCEIEIIWNLVVRKLPASNFDDLTRAGMLLEAALNAFEERFLTTEKDKRRVRAFASSVWWSVVRAGSTFLGPSALQLYPAVPGIAHYRPGLGEHARALASSVIPEFIRHRLRKTCHKGQSS